MVLFALQAAGAFFGLVPPFKQVYNYLEGLKESRDVEARLKIVLQPLDDFSYSVNASAKSGNALKVRVENLSKPVSVSNAEDLVQRMIQFCDDFADVLSSVLSFSKECSILIADFESFMLKVQRRKPTIYEIIRFFGKHYDPKTESLDLSNLSTFIGIYGPKLKKKDRKNNEDLSKQVAEGGRTVDKALDIARTMKKQRLRIIDRRLKKDFPRALKRLLKETESLRVARPLARDLSRNAPPWLIQLTVILEDVQEALPGLWGTGVYRRY